MIKRLTCIECPVGCSLSVDIENDRVIKVEGNTCPKGEAYARSEIESPSRVLTSAVLAEGLALKMVPVLTDKPIPKEKLLDAMSALKKITVRRNVKAGEVIAKNLAGSGADLIATRGTGS